MTLQLLPPWTRASRTVRPLRYSTAIPQHRVLNTHRRPRRGPAPTCARVGTLRPSARKAHGRLAVSELRCQPVPWLPSHQQGRARGRRLATVRRHMRHPATAYEAEARRVLHATSASLGQGAGALGTKARSGAKFPSPQKRRPAAAIGGVSALRVSTDADTPGVRRGCSQTPPGTLSPHRPRAARTASALAGGSYDRGGCEGDAPR